jgi:hypothetical protein
MSADDDLIGGLETLLDRVPSNYGVEEWRYLLRRVVYTVSMRVLETFPDIVVGPPPGHSPGPMPMMKGGAPQPASVGGPPRMVQAGGPIPPYRPNVGLLLCIATGDCQPPPATPQPAPQH